MDTLLRGVAKGSVLGIALLLLASCTGSTTGAGTGSSASSTAPSSSSPAEGLNTFGGKVIGRDESQSYTVEAPDGWSSYKHAFTVKDSGVDVMGVSVWDVGKVPLDPCHWKGTFRNATGSSVNDLVGLLETEKERNATEPEDATLEGYRGSYLQWSTPADSRVMGDSNFVGCDVAGNAHRAYLGWLGNGTGERYSIVAGQVDHIWVLDVKGQTLLVDAIHSPDATGAQVLELMNVAQSIHFN